MAPEPCDEGTPTPRRNRTKWSAPKARAARARAPKDLWVIRSREDFFDARVNPIKNHHLRMLLILEALCGVDCFCFHASQEIAARYGCNRRQLQTIFRQMEEVKLILRVFGDDEDDPDRVGIVLRKRSDPDRSVADTPEALAEAVAALKNRRLPGGSKLPSDPPREASSSAPPFLLQGS
jgi:AraC-like DNA-binding protein